MAMKYKREPIRFKPCIPCSAGVPKAVISIIKRLWGQKEEASKKIRFVLLASNGLNQAQKDALREAVNILEKK